MEYPVWQLSTFGGGFIIALVATLHVFVAHFAVGGGLFLVLTEARARREKSPAMLDYVKRHTRFFLLLTMVFGGLSGVGIWFTISVLTPSGTSALIHTFVFGWAAEWVFFACEIVALLIYYYGFERLSGREHMIIGWLYFLFAWLSLFLINGIVGFMLTPGAWLSTGDFWDGFFNPSFWPSLAFRTLLAVMLAGLFGFLTALRIPDAEARERIVRSCALWAAGALPLLLAVGWIYLQSLPADVLGFIEQKYGRIAPFYRAIPPIAAGIMAGALLMYARLPRAARTPIAALLLLGGFAFVGAFEFVREAGRKPWIIHGHIYSTGVGVAQAAQLAQASRTDGGSLLAQAKWARHKDALDNPAGAGRELFALQCLSCHSVGGPMNDILPLTAHVGEFGMEAYLAGQGRLFGHMPPFLGNAAEREALAGHIVTGLHGKAPDAHAEAAITPLEHDIPPFGMASDEYVLLAWNTLGMKCISDCDASFAILPPGNAMGALLIRRGDTPEVVSEGVEISYEAPQGSKNPASHVEFWRFAPSLLGKELPANVSGAGRGLDGVLAWDAKAGIHSAAGIPVTPYVDNGPVNPYPLFTVTARDKATGQVLAQTKAVLPVGSEMGCWNCHGGTWRTDGVTGIAQGTATNILAAHDRRSGTDLLARARDGKPVLCQSCHPDPLLNAQGRPELVNLPAAIHGFHANYLGGRGGEVCASCHPDSPTGVTRCLRDNHAAQGLGCPSCHGYLEDHALSLLKKEQMAGKPGAERLMRYIEPRGVATLAEISPRTPWLQEPDCMTCHEGYTRPEKTASAFNVWTDGGAGLYRNRKDEMGTVPCIACHNSPHATYPATNAYGADRDNIQPLQYQGDRGPMGRDGNCAVCHGPDHGLGEGMRVHDAH